MNEDPTSLRAGLRQLVGYFPRRRRLQGLALIGLMLVGAFAELLTIGAVLPFIALIADPEAAGRIPLLGEFLSLVGADEGREAILALAILFSALAVATATVRIVLTWASKTYVLRIGHDLSILLYRKLLYQPYMFHVSHNSSLGISSIGKVQAVVDHTLWPLISMLTAAVISVFILAVLVAISASVAIGAAVAFCLIYFAVSLMTRNRLERNGRFLAQSAPIHLQALQEGLGGIRDILIDQSQPLHVARIACIDLAMRKAQAANALIGALPRFVIEGFGMVMIAMLALMLNNQQGGLATALPVLGALALGAQRLLPLLQQVYYGWARVRGSRAVLLDVLQMLKLPLPADLHARRNILPMRLERAISLTDVSFRYATSGPMVLRNVNLIIPKGGRVGFIGKTGSGKSTLIDLVMGLLEPSSGTVCVDDQPLGGGNVPSWQVQIAHVPQHIFLTDATIMENIAFGLEMDRIDEQRVREAARKADIASFIEAQPEGYRSMIGERGVRLSGGQRQRIGIARALYKRSTVLVLDEATSALDDATEASIMESIDRLGRELTVLMIAHRITTLRNCDMICRLDRGSIVQQGDYETVVNGRAEIALPISSRAK